MWLLHVVVLQRTARNCSKCVPHVQRAYVFLVLQIKSFIRVFDVEVIPMNIGCFSHQCIVMSTALDNIIA